MRQLSLCTICRRSWPRLANVKAHRRDRRFARNKAASVRLSDRSGARRQFRPRSYSIRKAKLPHSFALASRREWLCIPVKRRHGITFMSISRSRESTIRRHTASIARALSWLRNTSLACGAAEIRIQHHIAGSYLHRYAQKSLRREDNRRVSNRD